MPAITYHGPSARLRVQQGKDTTVLERGVVTDVADAVASKAKKKAGDRVTVGGPKSATDNKEG